MLLSACAAVTDNAGSPEFMGADRASPQIGKKWRRADTNVVAIKFDQLKKPSNMHTGDPVSCQKCHAVMSHLSSVQQDGDEQVSHFDIANEAIVVFVSFATKFASCLVGTRLC